MKGKHAVVTGSTSGIGLAIATALAKEGCEVMLNGLGDPKEISKTCSAIQAATGSRVFYHGGDMSKPADVRDLIASAARDMGSLEILVNNAGVQHTDPVEAFPDDKWDLILAINLSSAFHAMKAALPLMRAAKYGRIINIASVHGLVASTNKAAYVAAKHGLVGLTKVVALETAEEPITCNAVCPGWVRTPLVEAQIQKLASDKKLSVEDAAVELLSEKQPSKRFVETDQLAATVVFLCSAAAANMTGTTITMDGGWTAR